MFNGTIKLKKDLLQRVERCAKAGGYSSPQEFVEHIIERELANLVRVRPDRIDIRADREWRAVTVEDFAARCGHLEAELVLALPRVGGVHPEVEAIIIAQAKAKGIERRHISDEEIVKKLKGLGYID